MATANITRTNGWTTAGARRWRLTDGYIEVEGEGVLRKVTSKDIPAVVWKKYGGAESSPIRTVALAYGYPVELFVALVSTESAGKAKAERYEPKLKDYSMGVCQTLTATASHVARRIGIGHIYSVPSVPVGGPMNWWREWLFQPMQSLILGGGYLALQDERWKCQMDPVLLYCCYNAGGLYVAKNKWGLRNYGSALEAFVRFYNEAVEVIRG